MRTASVLLLAFLGCSDQAPSVPQDRKLHTIPADVHARWVHIGRDGNVFAYVAGKDETDQIVVNGVAGPVRELT